MAGPPAFVQVFPEGQTPSAVQSREQNPFSHSPNTHCSSVVQNVPISPIPVREHNPMRDPFCSWPRPTHIQPNPQPPVYNHDWMHGPVVSTAVLTGQESAGAASKVRASAQRFTTALFVGSQAHWVVSPLGIAPQTSPGRTHAMPTP